MATMPVFKCEAAFGSGPGSITSATWTDISAYLDIEVGFSWHRGRQHELDTIQPGQMTVTLDNSSGVFTPGRGAFGLTFNTPLRLSATWLSTYYPLALGFADAVPVTWEGGVRSLITLTATDRFKILAKRTLRTAYREQVLADGPMAYYPLDDPAGSSGFASLATTPVPSALIGSSKYGAVPPTLAAVSNPLAGDPGGTAPTFPAGIYYYDYDDIIVQQPGMIGAPSFDLGGTWSAEWWAQITTVPGVLDAIMFSAQSGSRTIDARTSAYLSGNVSLVYDSASGNSIDGPAHDGNWHHYAVVMNAGTLTFYVDGVGYGSTPTGVPAGSPTDHVTFAAGPYTFQGGPGNYAHLALYSRALTASQVAVHAQIGATGMLATGSNSVTARVAQMATWTGVPTTSLDASVTQNTAAQAISGTDAVTALQALGLTEHGLVYMGPSDDLRLRSRLDLVDKTPAFTADVQAQGIDASTAFTVDDQLLINDYTATRPSGSTVRVVSATSVGNNGTYSGNDTLLVTTDGELTDAANYMITTHANPAPRGDQVKVDPLTSPSLWPAVLASDLGQMFTITGLPAEAPAASMNLLIQQITATISATACSFQFDTSAADPVPYVVLDSTAFGLLDTDALFF